MPNENKSLEKKTDLLEQQNENRFLEKGTLNHPYLKLFTYMTGDIITLITKLATGGTVATFFAGLTVAFTIVFLIHLALMYRDYVQKQNSTLTSPIPKDFEPLQIQPLKVTKRDCPLNLEIKDVLLIMQWIGESNRVFVSVTLSVTNLRPENNTIKSCRLLVDNGKFEGQLQNQLLTNPVIFSQGIPDKFVTTFRFNDEFIYLDNNITTIRDKPFVIKLTDSYGNLYEERGTIPLQITAT